MRSERGPSVSSRLVTVIGLFRPSSAMFDVICLKIFLLRTRGLITVMRSIETISTAAACFGVVMRPPIVQLALLNQKSRRGCRTDRRQAKHHGFRRAAGEVWSCRSEVGGNNLAAHDFADPSERPR